MSMVVGGVVLDSSVFVQLLITVSAVVGTFLAYRRGVRKDKTTSDTERVVHDDQHQIDLIRVTQEAQQSALTNYQSQLAACGERAARLEGRVDELTREHAADRQAWEDEKRSLRHEIGNLKVNVQASKIIVDRQDAELRYWRERAMLSESVVKDLPAPGEQEGPADGGG
jgi:hypothetical protein